MMLCLLLTVGPVHVIQWKSVCLPVHCICVSVCACDACAALRPRVTTLHLSVHVMLVLLRSYFVATVL